MKKVKTLLLMLTLFFTFMMVTNAESTAVLNYTGDEEVVVGELFKEYIKITDINGANLNAISGSINIENKNCVNIVSIVPVSNKISAYLDRFIYVDFESTKEDTTLLEITYRASKNICTTNISIDDAAIAFTNGDYIEKDKISKTINVIEPIIIEETKPIVEEEPIIVEQTIIEEKKEEVEYSETMKEETVEENIEEISEDKIENQIENIQLKEHVNGLLNALKK